MLTVITGPPCSGKTTYARQHAKPGDIVVDFDALAQALGSPVSHGHDHHLWKVAVEARAAAVRAAVAQHRGGATAWVIDSRPDEQARQRYLEAGARIVDMSAPREELHRRASQERPPSWHARIDTFLDGKDPQPRAVTKW